MPDTDFRLRLGQALVARELLPLSKLKEANARLQTVPHLSFKQILTVFYHITMAELDHIEFEDLILPQVPELLLERLRDIVKKDRFAGGLDVDEYVVNIECLLQNHETQSTERRTYPEGERGKREQPNIERFDATQVKLLVVLRTKDRRTAQGRIHVHYRSLDPKARIIDEEDALKGTLYYALRQAYKEAVRK